MEVFSAFATLSLVDMLSSPLDRIRSGMASLQGQTGAVGQAFGNLTMAMAPVALAAGVVVGALGLCTSKAMAFESAMADVAKVVNFGGPAEFQAMSQQVKELAGRIPMAADGIAAIIAAAGQSGVAKENLTEFAEQAAKMGVAFDLTGDQSGKMMADWRAGMALTLPQTYALADAVNHLSNNMNATAPALGEVIQRIGAAAMSCGLAETQVAALGAAFLSAGASPEVAATALKKFTTTLVKGTAMSKEQAAAFQGLGFSATQMAKDMQTDAQGTIFKVLQAIADKPKELQMSLLTEMFGEEAIGAIAPLLKNMGLLDQSFKLVGNAANYAGSMQAEFEARSKTAQNALILLSNKLTNLAISVGSVFLPFVSKAAAALGGLVDAVRAVVDSPFGQWLVGMVGAVSGAVLAFTAFSAGLWALSGVGGMVGKALLPLKAVLLGFSWPVWVIVGVITALYLAFRSNFGGIADVLSGWWRKASLVVRGVVAVFQNLTNGVGTIKGELAKEIKAVGLEGLVTAVSRIVYRIQKFFAGIAEGMAPALAAIDEILLPARLVIADFLLSIENVFGNVDSAVGGSVSTWVDFGRAVGEVVGGALKLAAHGFVWLMEVVNATGQAIASCYKGVWGALSAGFDSLAATFSQVWSRLEGVFLAFMQAGSALGNAFSQLWATIAPVFERLFGANVMNGVNIWESFGNVVSNVVAAALFILAQAFQIALTPLEMLINYVRMVVSLFSGDFAGAADALRGIVASLGSGFAALGDLFGVGDSIRAAWADIMTYFDSINLFESGAKLLGTFVDGIKSMAGSLYSSVADALTSMRNLLPFSDAKEGPLSTLTLSGTRMMTTLAGGVTAGASSLLGSVTGVLSGVGKTLGGWWDGVIGGIATGKVPQPVPEASLQGVAAIPQGVAAIPQGVAAIPQGVAAIPQGVTPISQGVTPIPQGATPAAISTAMPSVTMPPTAMPPLAQPTITGPSINEPAASNGSGRREAVESQASTGGVTIHIANLNLPNVSSKQEFISGLQGLVAEYEGA